jgi:hypothetical protein
MWVAAGVLALSVAAWCVSLTRVQWTDDRGMSVWLYYGDLSVGNFHAIPPFELRSHWHMRGLAWPRWQWPDGEHFLGFVTLQPSATACGASGGRVPVAA